MYRNEKIPTLISVVLLFLWPFFAASAREPSASPPVEPRTTEGPRSSVEPPADRRAAESWMMMMLGMAGLGPEDSPWLAERRRAGVEPTPMSHAGAHSGAHGGDPGEAPAGDDPLLALGIAPSRLYPPMEAPRLPPDFEVPETAPDGRPVMSRREWERHYRMAATVPIPGGYERYLQGMGVLPGGGVQALQRQPMSTASHASAPTAEALAGGDFAGIHVEILPGDAELPPELAGAPRFAVEATPVALVYNRFGGRDPRGMIYLLREDREKVIAGSRFFNAGHDPLFHGSGRQGDLFLKDPASGRFLDAGGEEISTACEPEPPPPGCPAKVPVLTTEPLVLRANVGQTVVIDFTNRLAEQRANLLLHGASYDESALAQARQAAPEPAPADSELPQLRYVLHIGDREASEGTYYFHSQPAAPGRLGSGIETAVEQIAHGLFGALVVEPRGSLYYDPEHFEMASRDGFGNYEIDPAGYRPARAGWGAIVANEDPEVPAFREYVLFFHDDLARRVQGLVEQDPRAISYRTEPFSDLFSSEVPGTRPRIGGARPFPTNDRALAYSAYAYGDSSTPHPRFYVGDPVRYRVIHAGTGDQFHVFHHHAHRWRFQPGLAEPGARGGTPNRDEPSKWGRPTHEHQPDVTHSTSIRIDSQTLGPAETFDVFMEGGAGSVQRSVGDALLHCHIIEHVTQGMWTYARVYNTLQQRSSRLPGLAPLPDRLERPRRPPMAVDSATLASMVRAGAGPVPVGGPLAGRPIREVEGELMPYIEAQLPPRGLPTGDEWADPEDEEPANRADRWDWSLLELDARGTPLYLGAPYDTEGSGAVRFGAGFPSVGEGVGAERPEDDPRVRGTGRPRLLFNPDDGRLAYPLLLPHAGRRPPFAPKLALTPDGEGGFTTAEDPIHQGTAYLGPRFGLQDPGRAADGEALGVATGSPLAPVEAEAAGDVKHFDIVALELPIDYATFNGRPVPPDNFGVGLEGGGQDDDEPRRVLIRATEQNVWEITVDGRLQTGSDIVLRAGDTLEWRVEGGDLHGLTFQRFEDAEAFLDFDPAFGQPLQPQPDYGPEARGTYPVAPGSDLARATVKAGTALRELPFLCTEHGRNMSGRLCLGPCVNDNPYLDPHGQIFALRGDVPDILAGRKRAEPLVIRANAGDVVDITLTSALVDREENRFYSKVGIHSHLVQYDMQSSDGAVGGLNFETAVRPALRWDEERGELVPLDEAMDFGEQVHYRWWCDVELGTVYFHDHSLLKDSLPHGLFGATIVEPPGATYHDPRTGEPIYRRDGGRIAATNSRGGTAQADIRLPGAGQAFRELVPLFNDVRDSINLRRQPLLDRVGAPGGESTTPDLDGAGLSGGIETAFSSLLHGDPVTPLWRIYEGDPVRIRTEGGGHQQIHTLHMHGARWRYEENNPFSPLRDFALVGVSEGFSFRLDEDSPPSPGDHFYGSQGADDLLRRGKWGLLRVYPGGESGAGARAEGSVRVYLDRPAAVRVPAGHLFHSERGVAYAAAERSLSEGEVRANKARAGTPEAPRDLYFFDVPLTALDAGDEGNLPAGVAFATDAADLSFEAGEGGGGESEIVRLESATPLRGGRTPLARLEAETAAAASAADPPAVPAAPEPAGAAADARFHIVALEAELPRREPPTEDGPPPTGRQILIEASSSRTWNFSDDGERLLRREVQVNPGDALRWTVSGGKHGLTFLDFGLAQKLLRFEPDTGLPFDDDGYGGDSRGTKGASEGTLLATATVRRVAEPTELLFFCTLHGTRMKGKLLFQPADGEPTGLRALDGEGVDPVLVFMELRGEGERQLAEAITAKTRRREDAEEEIAELTALLRERFARRPEPLVLRVAAPEEGEGGPAAVEIRLTNLLPETSEHFDSPTRPWSSTTSLHAGLLAYDVRDSDGTAMGENPHSLVLRGDSRSYLFTADRELGISYLRDTANPAHSLRGLFGALIVEPPGASFAPAVPGDPEPAGWQARVTPGDGTPPFREFVLFLHDGWPNSESGFAINYHAARGFEDAPPTPTLRAHAGDPIVVRQVHAAGLGGLSNHSFFIAAGRWPFDLEGSPGTNRVSAVTEGVAAAFNLRLSPFAEPTWSLYGSHVGSHLKGGEWGLVEILPPGDESILSLDGEGEGTP